MISIFVPEVTGLPSAPSVIVPLLFTYPHRPPEYILTLYVLAVSSTEPIFSLTVIVTFSMVTDAVVLRIAA